MYILKNFKKVSIYDVLIFSHLEAGGRKHRFRKGIYFIFLSEEFTNKFRYLKSIFILNLRKYVIDNIQIYIFIN